VHAAQVPANAPTRRRVLLEAAHGSSRSLLEVADGELFGAVGLLNLTSIKRTGANGGKGEQ
jgi:hypothetical protein